MKHFIRDSNRQGIGRYKCSDVGGQRMEYDYPFINQYIEIPDSISKKIDNLYASQKPAVRHCIKLIITNLLAHGVVAYSRRGEYYGTHHTEYYTKTYFNLAVKLLEKGNYILPPERGGIDLKYKKGFSSRLHPSYQLDIDFPESQFRRNFSQLDLTALPLLQVNDYLIYKISDISKRVVAKPSIPNTSTFLPNTSTTSFPFPLRHFFEQSLTLNRDYFNNIKLDYRNLKLEHHHMEDVGLTRIIKNNGCGRWYQKGGLSYQEVAEEDRIKILLNGLEVNELDYSAMHPNILYTWENQQAPIDIYQDVIDYLKANGYPTMDKFPVNNHEH
jgi:hypothetical protein